MASDFDIGNLALQLLGDSTRITSLAQSIKGARAVNACYAFLRQAELRSNTWKFAIRRSQLVSDLVAPNYGRQHQFSLPTGHLRLLPKYPEQRTWPRDWLVEGQKITSNDNDGTFFVADVRVATTAAGTLASDFENGDTIDGVVLATGDRILIKNQVAGAENGIYTVNASGAPTRATDFNTAATEVRFGAYTQATAGTANANKTFLLSTNDPITLGTTALTFTEVSATPATLLVRDIQDITNVDQMDPLFQIALAAKIAFQICEEITNSTSKQQLAGQRYKDAILQARQVNAIEKPPTRAVEDSWIVAREDGFGFDYTRVYINR